MSGDYTKSTQGLRCYAATNEKNTQGFFIVYNYIVQRTGY